MTLWTTELLSILDFSNPFIIGEIHLSAELTVVTLWRSKQQKTRDVRHGKPRPCASLHGAATWRIYRHYPNIIADLSRVSKRYDRFPYCFIVVVRNIASNTGNQNEYLAARRLLLERGIAS